jgi:Protein of unknown function (DUF3489)
MWSPRLLPRKDKEDEDVYDSTQNQQHHRACDQAGGRLRTGCGTLRHCRRTRRTRSGLARAGRLIEIWNSIPGTQPVKKFTDRKTAATRIWKNIQILKETIPCESAPEATSELVTPFDEPQAEPPAAQPTANVGAQTDDVAPQPVLPVRTATGKKKGSTGEPKPQATRTGSKTEAILSLLKRPGGASLQEIMKATDWQAHSVRGFISGTLGKKMSLAVVSAKTSDGERNYSIEA